MLIVAHCRAGEPIELGKWWRREQPVFQEDTFVVYNSWLTENEVRIARLLSTLDPAHRQWCS